MPAPEYAIFFATLFQYQKIVFLVPKHAGLQRTLKLEFSINTAPSKSIYRCVQVTYMTYMIANDHFMINEHFSMIIDHGQVGGWRGHV